MKLYKIWQDKNNGYDTYSEAVVAAKSPKEAINTKIGNTGDYGSWVEPQYVQVIEIGTAKRGTKAEIIVASFHAG